MKDVLTLLAESVLLPLGVTAPASASSWEVSKSIENEAKEQKGKFLGMLLGTLAASLLRNMFAGKTVIITGKGTITTDEETIRTGE